MTTTQETNPALIAFQMKYRYRIGGKVDMLFSSVGSLINREDTLSFNLFKSQRMREVGAINTLKKNESDQAVVLTRSAEIKMDFLDNARRVLMKAGIGKTASATRQARAAVQISREFTTSLDNYINGRGQMDPAADMSAGDAAFAQKAQALRASLQSSLSRLTVYLRQEGVFFSKDLNTLKKQLQRADAQIATINAGAFPTSDPAPPVEEGGESGDAGGDDPSFVPPSPDTGGTLDVEA